MGRMDVTRRGFIEVTGGLVLGFAVPLKLRPYLAEAAGAAPVALGAFLRIAPDDSVTILVNHSEMGQGVWTGLTMLIAEELEADWSKIRVEHAPAAPAYYSGGEQSQGTGGSGSIIGEVDRLRQVGATAREMLVAAAAKRWKVDPAELRAENGFVLRGRERISFGKLAAEAAKLEPPASVKLKDPAHWKLIGKPTKRLDTPEKVTGRAKFGIDVRFPGLLTAVVLRAPTLGATVKKWNADKALRVPGVRKVVQVPTGLAVVADHFWAAQTGREALEAEWEPGAGADFDSDEYLAKLRMLAATPEIGRASCRERV